MYSRMARRLMQQTGFDIATNLALKSALGDEDYIQLKSVLRILSLQNVNKKQGFRVSS